MCTASPPVEWVDSGYTYLTVSRPAAILWDFGVLKLRIIRGGKPLKLRGCRLGYHYPRVQGQDCKGEAVEA